MRKHQVQALLTGGQACVFYGAVQFSKDIDLLAVEDLVQAKKTQRDRDWPVIAAEMDSLREALDVETRAEQAKDRAYWAPLKAELEDFRRTERGG
jgi:hypothetical protein